MSLPSAVVAPEKINTLLDAGFTADEIAKACGVTESAVIARRTGTARRKTALDRRLDDLFFLTEEMREFGLDEEIARGWMCSRSMHLNGQKPLDLIRRDAFDEVRSACEAFMDGESASEYRSKRSKDSADDPAVGVTDIASRRRTA